MPPRVMQTASRSVGGLHMNRARSQAGFDSDDDEDDADNMPPFEGVNQNIAKIGGVTLDRFLQSPTDVDDFDMPYHIRENQETSPTPPNLPPTELDPPVKVDGPLKMQCVAQLHHTCQRAFGKTDMLKFEFIEVDGPNTKRCILTITRPNGARRSYQTPGVYSRKNEAKLQTAAIAIKMGAIDFITTGGTDLSKPKGLILAPLDASGESDSAAPEPEDQSVKEIEDCCAEWRAGRVKPNWVALTEPKFGNKRGCALRIRLSPHSLRVYSSDTKYEAITDAKAACAKIALDQGVLEFIKHGNGQVEPEKSSIVVSDADVDAQEAEDKAKYIGPTALTLQTFYERFPQPFPENFGDKSAVEINAPSWLNSTIQGARGGRLSTNFIWTTNEIVWGGNLGLHGCLLRIERPGDSRSYLVDARFPKRADAKSAVCLQAISQGVGDYIRGIGREMENKITPTMRRWANDFIFPTLGSECSKVKPGTHPRYDFQKEKDAYGCTMTLDLDLTSSRTYEHTKTFIAPTDYRTKADAKIAVACIAAEHGAVEFLRFRGYPPPSGYQTFHSTLISGMADASNKRKAKEDDGPQERKKSRNDVKEGDRQVPLLESKNETMIRLNTRRSPCPFPSPNNSGRKHPRGPAPGGFGATSTPAQGSPIAQPYSGSRAMSNSSSDYRAAELRIPPVDPRPSVYGPQVPTMPAGPSRAGPVMLGIPGNHPLFMPTPHEHPSHGGPQDAVPQPTPFSPRPPSQPLPQGSQYPPTTFPSIPPTTGYHFPRPNILPGTPPYTFPQQHYGATAGPFPTPTTAGFPYCSYSHAPFSLPQHSAAPFSLPQHSTYPHALGPPASSSGVNWAPGYEIPPAPIQHPHNVPIQQQLHKSHSTCTPAPVQVNKSDEGCSVTSSSRVGAQSKSPIGAGIKEPLEEDTQLTITPALAEKSHVASLFDYCKESILKPQFHHKTIADDSGKINHKVWVIMGNEKLELPVTFATESEGRERVAKQVLSRLRSQGKKKDKF